MEGETTNGLEPINVRQAGKYGVQVDGRNVTYPELTVLLAEKVDELIWTVAALHAQIQKTATSSHCDPDGPELHE